MKRIEYITPSANPPNRRISPTTRPIPRAYIQVPLGVIGDVTISVAIKKAPIRRPPAKIWNEGGANLLGLTSQNIPAKKLSARMIPMGIRQSIVFL
jgi:hypothetical protein